MANGERRNLQHFYLRDHGHRERFTSPRTGGGGRAAPERNRAQHAQKLERALTAALDAAARQIGAREADLEGGKRGFYLQFDLPAAQRPMLDKLEDRRGADQIELVSVRHSIEHPDSEISATVFVPESKSEVYLRKVREYQERDTHRGRPRNEPLVASIDTVRLAQVRSLYTDETVLFPEDDQQTWWEIWLRRGSLAVFQRAAERLRVEIREHTVRFAEREVVLARAAPRMLGRILANTDAIAELRLARDTPSVFMEMAPLEQREWADDLVDRLEAPADDAPAVCLLDSGSTRAHPLIAPALAADDQQAWDITWTVEDIGQWRGHGTQMSGLALYGDLTPLLIASDPVPLTHRLESVKILPDRGANDPKLYGYITATAVGTAEIQAPDRNRAFCLAVTAKGPDWRGRPSSWSAALDDLCYGDGNDRRLIVVSAGNIDALYPAREYYDQNDGSPVESPAQSWNALTVGAVTEKRTITDPTYAGWSPLAPAGDLSPLSRTSVSWSDDWPLKPDVVFEGGNLGVDPLSAHGDRVNELLLLTAHYRLHERLFTVTGDTSAATALVSGMASQIYADNDRLWPETVRALIVHSAEWTPAMIAHLPANPQQPQKRLLLRRYGYGVPNLDRELRSTSNDVTLVAEGHMRPFRREGSDIKTRDMVMHQLPWPTETLEAFDDAEVEMKVTLSYFVEPNPGERGWTKRHRYQSHGLRFAVKRAEENVDQFMRRINRAARDVDEDAPAGMGADDGWLIGPRLRDRGSIHSDTWKGTAVDLANRQGIVVYPIGGWWREKRQLERYDSQVRYTLIITLRAAEGVDLYAEIQAAIRIEAEVEV